MRGSPAKRPWVGAFPAWRRETARDPGRVLRKLRDGSEFEIVKRYWSPDELVADFESVGWQASCNETTFAFLYGSARPRRR